MEKTIYLVRHAHIETYKRMIGSLDLPLSQMGKEQAKTLQKLLLKEHCMKASSFQNIYVSPLTRARQTADIILDPQNIYEKEFSKETQLLSERGDMWSQAESLKVECTFPLECSFPLGSSFPYTLAPLLKEIHLGAWEGLKKQEIQEKYPELWQKRGENIAHTAPPQGESFAHVEERVIPFFQEIILNMHNNLPVLIVAHQAVNRVILGHLQNIPLKNILTIPQEYASLTRIKINNAHTTVDIIN